MNPAEQFLVDRGISLETAAAFGLVYDERRHAVEIPYRSALGEVIVRRYRMLNPGGAKVLPERKGDKLHLYNVRDTDRDTVYVVEGEMDCLVMAQEGHAAVGVPGIKGFKPEWRWLFEGADVTVIFDGETEARQKAMEVCRLLYGHAETIRNLSQEMPDDMDINDLYLAGRLEDFLRA